MEPRIFNDRQRQALFLISDGRCQECGRPLPAGWHADHVHPYSKGGQTDVINGQALCPECNLKKGDKTMMEGLGNWPQEIEPRKWQEEVYNDYFAKGKSDYLMVATPGAGKTVGSLRIIHSLFRQGLVRQVIIVCPSERLKEQWTDEANKVGLHLHPNWEPSWNLKDGYHGIAVTYQAIASNSEIYRWLTQKRATVVLFDEVHHAGDQLSWGDSVKHAFEGAIRRIGISGTPFRSDNNKIPFVIYENGQSVADYSYGYGDALRDQVCRYVAFPTFDGDMEWFDGLDYVSATFRDELDEQQAAYRLRTALSANENWIKDVIRAANERLDDLRKTTDQSAGGLVIAMDKAHADSVAGVMNEIIGIKPVVVHSDNPDSLKQIDQFTRSNDKWIVSVRMISEGVDIRRLRVGVYATNFLTELYFRQAVGRVVRRQGKADEMAWFYVPKDHRLVKYMEEIKQERSHDVSDEDYEKQTREPGDRNGQTRMFLPNGAEAIQDDTYFDGSSFTQEQVLQAQQIAISRGINIDPVRLADLMVAFEPFYSARKEVPAPAPKPVNTPAPVRKDKRESYLRWITNKLANKLYYIIIENYRISASWTVGRIHHRWVVMGNSKAKDAPIEELERKYTWLEGLINQAESRTLDLRSIL